MSQPATFQVRKECRHGLTHPHSVTIFDRDPAEGEMFKWCTRGDTAILTVDELERRIFAELTESTPRVDLQTAAVKASQIVQTLSDLVREGAEVPKR